MVQLSHPYMTTGKTIALTMRTFVSKVTSLLFNMLSRFVIAFLPRSKCLLNSRLQSPSAVILEPKKIKSLTVSFVSPSICHEVMGLDAMILVFRSIRRACLKQKKIIKAFLRPFYRQPPFQCSYPAHPHRLVQINLPLAPGFDSMKGRHPHFHPCYIGTPKPDRWASWKLGVPESQGPHSKGPQRPGQRHADIEKSNDLSRISRWSLEPGLARSSPPPSPVGSQVQTSGHIGLVTTPFISNHTLFQQNHFVF